MKQIKIISIVAMSFLAAFHALAWNGTGHRAVAKLTWRELNSKERAAATELLRQHPHYEAILIADVPPGVDTNEWAFLTAAVWPDQVRPAKSGQPERPKFITKYNLHPHGIDLPFLLPGETNTALLSQYPRPAPARDLRQVMADMIKTLQNRKASAHDRAVSLGWVLHLMGDSHQPLHASTLVTAENPKGYDLGGSLVFRTLSGEEISMHAYWDQLPGMDGSYEAVTKLADSIAATPEFKRSKLREYGRNRTIDSWVQESYDAAASFAYAPDRVKYVPAVEVKAGKISKTEVPMITPSYDSDARKLAQRRLAIAHHRLTKILKDTW